MWNLLSSSVVSIILPTQIATTSRLTRRLSLVLTVPWRASSALDGGGVAPKLSVLRTESRPGWTASVNDALKAFMKLTQSSRAGSALSGNLETPRPGPFLAGGAVSASASLGARESEAAADAATDAAVAAPAATAAPAVAAAPPAVDADLVAARIPHPHDPDARLFLHHGDLSDGTGLRRILEAVQPDEIYNLGAQSHVKVSFEQPEYTADVVGTGTLRLFEAVRDHLQNSESDIRLYQAGSSEMFGAAAPPQLETTAFEPRSPYAISKVAGYWFARN